MEPTVPTLPEITTTTNPYAVPATIDAAYVNRVLEALDAALGDVYRLVIRTRDVSPEVIDRLNAIYLNRDDVNLELQAIQRGMREGFTGFKDPVGNPKSTVTELITASPSCIFARFAPDNSAMAVKSDGPSAPEWVGLQPADPARDPNHYNGTPWMIATEGLLFPNGSPPPNPCAKAA